MTTLHLLLKELRLPTMLRIWQEFANQAKVKNWSVKKYLQVLCEHEITERQSRKLSKWMNEAHLPQAKSLETYDFTFVNSLDKSQIKNWSYGHGWIKEGFNFLIFGPSDVGKTHLAAAIGEKLIESGFRVLFIRTTELVQKLQAAKRDLGLPQLLDKLEKYDCLILDDFAYVKKDELETNVLFELICERYERKSLLITCNQPFKDWDQIFVDKIMVIAAIDRLIHHAIILEINEESYRKKAALARSEKQTKKKNSKE